MRTTNHVASLFIVLLIVVSQSPGCEGGIIATSEEHNRNCSTGGAGVVRAIRNMTAKRAAHTTTLLNNGNVLIAGGFVGEENGLRSAELFDPTTNTFTLGENMKAARAGHTATL